MKSDVEQASEADVQKVTWWMGLVDVGIKALHCQGEIDGIQIVQIPAPKYPRSATITIRSINGNFCLAHEEG